MLSPVSRIAVGVLVVGAVAAAKTGMARRSHG